MPDLVARPVRLRHPPPFPSTFQHLQIAMPAAAGVDAHAVVVDLADGVDERLVDEAVRRHWWSADHGQLTTRRATARQLADEGAPVLRPSALGWVDPAERALPGFPLAPDDDDSERLWVRARRDDACGSAEGWMPYTLAVARSGDARPDEPLVHPPLLGGFGAGVDPGAALDAAWRAVVVEDALWCWWTGSVPAASVDAAPEVRRLWADADLELTLRLVDVGTLGPVTVAAVDDTTVQTVGGGWGRDGTAQRTAIARALWQLVIARELDDPATSLSGPGVLAHRPDRRYLPRSPSERRRLLDPLAHVQLALDPRSRGDLRRLLGTGDGMPPAPRAGDGMPPEPPDGAATPPTGDGMPPAPRDGARMPPVPPEGAPTPPTGDGMPPAPRDGVRPAPVGDAEVRPGAAVETWSVALAPDGRVVRVLSPAAIPLPLGAFRLDPALVARASRRTHRLPTPRAFEQAPFPGW
ncbi:MULTISPECIES: YcaO-like family protein [Microbacterium]|uniref:YcaO-like family protein n=1 Tax=Microbacterium TaxID=33882 RepID=UPI00277DA66C|nr:MULTISPECIES: YcaO-like family protein [Microbacterium]MDQ1082224.1 hypothetical protein [Microbacterium sp. SORGH_AS_0344]MDQ1169005.1 hypothetical protein [Microbacterium proteolyticum]